MSRKPEILNFWVLNVRDFNFWDFDPDSNLPMVEFNVVEFTGHP